MLSWMSQDIKIRILGFTKWHLLTNIVQSWERTDHKQQQGRINPPRLTAVGLQQPDASESLPWVLENRKESYAAKSGLKAPVPDSSHPGCDWSDVAFTFRWVEDAVGLLIAHVTAFRFAVVLQCTGLTEIMSAPETPRSKRTFHINIK